MSTISPSESQYFKELVTPFQPMGRLLIGTDLRGTQCDRFGKGELRLVGYGDSSGGYAFTPKNQDAAIAPSFNSANLSNIANSLPRITEVQDMAGKWIDSITLHALDEFLEQTQPQSFIANTLRIFAGSQKDFRSDGNANRFTSTQYTLIAEIPIPALTRADIPRSFMVKVAAYIPPAQNIYLGLAIPQPYTCSFELWDLQANTLVSSGLNKDTFVGVGNDLNEDNPNPSSDFNFVLPMSFASATWRLGAGSLTGSQYGPTPFIPLANPSNPSNPSLDRDPSKPKPTSPSQPGSPSSNGKRGVECQCLPPASRYLGWFDTDIADGVNGLFSIRRQCVGGKPTFLVGYSAAYMPNDSCGIAVGYWGRSSYCPWDESNIPTPPCTLISNKWKCTNGTCVEDVLGTYNSQAECEAALVHPVFTGGQCVGIAYRVAGKATITHINGTVTYDNFSFDSLWGGAITGKILGGYVRLSNLTPTNGYEGTEYGISTSSRGNLLVGGTNGTGGTGIINITIQINSVTRIDGLPDTCGNPPLTCP